MKYLIVDDHALVAGALTLLLEDRDPEADVHTAATADAALELVDREGDADLLILDLSLPGVTGTELMEEIVCSSVPQVLCLNRSTRNCSQVPSILCLRAACTFLQSF